MPLNKQQEAAVLADGDLLVTAAPGSGKTTVIVHRGERLLKSEPGNLIAISFTNDAAAQLKTRFNARIGSTHSRRLLTSNFHRLCNFQDKHAKIDNQKKIISEHERYKLIKTIVSKRKNIDFESALKSIDFLKSVLKPSLGNDDASIVYAEYQASLDKMNVLDYSDLLLNAVRNIHDGIIRPLPAKWMLVDEFQDIDEVQYELIMCYHRNGTQITGVGDDDQSLYSFRHALGFNGMMRFMQETNAQMVTLPVNYRSGPLIIEKASCLISKNQSRVPKEMQSGNKIQCNIFVTDYSSDTEEADEICKTIITSGSSFCEFAVLARNNRQLDKIETSLKSMNIPYSRTGEKFMDLAEPQAIISLLKSLVDNSTVGLRHTLMWMGVPDLILDSFVNDHHCNIESLYSHLPKDNPNKKAIKEFIEIYSQWLSLIEEGGKESLIIKGVASFFKRFCDEKKHRHFDSAAVILCRYRGTIKQRLGQLINENDKRSDGVSLMTIHASKGLEFDSVWLLGANDLMMPGENRSEELLQEERRIFYVAITRARENLYISHTDTPSIFITEAKLCE